MLKAGSSTDEFDNILAEDGNVFALEDGFISQGDDILYEGFTVDNEVNWWHYESRECS